jgi:hypothetical protein
MKKGIGEKVLGWFIVEEDDEATSKPEAGAPVIDDAPAAPEVGVAPVAARVHARGDAKLLDAPRAAPESDVLRAAGVPDADRERLRRVLTLIASLPAEATLDVKRAIVAASLEAFGVRIDDIVMSGEGAIAALDRTIETTRARSEQTVAQATSRIEHLTREIEALRSAIDAEKVGTSNLVASVESEKSRMREAIAFFARPSSARLRQC